MDEQALAKLLTAADALAPAASTSGAADLAARVRRSARIRTQRSRALGSVAAAALLAGAWFSGAGPTRWSAPPLGGRAVIARSEPPHGAAHEDEAWRRRLSLLAGEAESRLALARRTEDLLASRGAARARVGGAAQPDVMTEALLAAEAAAQTLLQKGDRFAHNLNMPREAAREYRRVERLYPETAGARSAARRLSSLPDGA